MIYVFDLDGTLCHTDGNDYAAARPIPSRIAAVNALFDAGHTIIVESARGTVTGIDWNAITRSQLESWGLRFHEVRTGVKKYGDFYIDDKAVLAEDFFKL